MQYYMLSLGIYLMLGKLFEHLTIAFQDDWTSKFKEQNEKVILAAFGTVWSENKFTVNMGISVYL